MSKAEKSFPSFFKGKKVLIAEPSPSASTIIHQVLVALGCEPGQIHRENDFDKAAQHLRSACHVIVSEYQIGTGFGLELAERQAQVIDDSHDRIFLLSTANNNDSTIAEAAEGDVDGYVLKPFTIKQLTDLLVNIIEKKMKPSPYSQKTMEGRKWLKDGDAKKAAEVLAAAKTLDPKPALACYFHGLALKLLNDPDGALASFREGRKHNQLHYKCLQGEFDILFERKDYAKAYETLRLIYENFPVSPATLEKIFILAIFTGNFRDLDLYHQRFVELDRRPLRLIKVVTEAFISSGRLFLKENDLEQAISQFKKAATTSQRNPEALQKITNALIRGGHADQAQEFVKMYPPEAQTSAAYIEADFEACKGHMSPWELIQKGKKLIDDGLATPSICRTVIGLLIEQKKETAAEQVIYKATILFPELRNEFRSLMSS